MNYKESLDYIFNIGRIGSDYGIERMRELLNLLDNPQKDLKFIHVAGTNGKGSTCAYLTSIFCESGKKVGTYNSPSVFSYNERWSINKKPVSNELVAFALTKLKDAIDSEKEKRDFQPTAFEIETAMAFIIFKEEKVDICVLEVGLGGRWDATNVIEKKEMAVIVPIGLDHTQFLGNTLGEIASEKAGIIKGEVVTCKQDDEILKEFRHPFEIIDGEKIYRNSKVYIAKETTLISSSKGGQTFLYDGKEYHLSMLGIHQLQNASIAIETIHQLNKKGYSISDETIDKGLKSTNWGARLEIVKNAKERFNISIPDNKTLVFDGSHNPHGAKTLQDGIDRYFKKDRICMVLGILKDKDVEGIVKLLVDKVDKVICVTPPSIRAMKNDELETIVRNYNQNVITNSDIKQAVQQSLDDSHFDTVILCGSLTLFENLGV